MSQYVKTFHRPFNECSIHNVSSWLVKLPPWRNRLLNTQMHDLRSDVRQVQMRYYLL